MSSYLLVCVKNVTEKNRERKSESSIKVTYSRKKKRILRSIVRLRMYHSFHATPRRRRPVLGPHWKVSTESVKRSKDSRLPIGEEHRGWKVSRNRAVNQAGEIVEDPLPNNVRWLANASDANDKQTNRGLSRITSPQGVLSCHDEPGVYTPEPSSEYYTPPVTSLRYMAYNHPNSLL